MSLEDAFSDGPVFVPYLVVGDPGYGSSLEYVKTPERNGVDIIKLGLPFSEPIAERSTIQNTVAWSLESGVTPIHFFEFVEGFDMSVSLACITYYNLIHRYDGKPGSWSFAGEATEVGIESFAVPDLPTEEVGLLREICDEPGLDLIFIVTPTTHGERLDRIMEQVSSYVYVQVRPSTTDAQSNVSDQTGSSLRRLTGYNVPEAVGFGINDGDHAKRVVASGADGVIVDNASVGIVAKGHESGDDVGTVADRFETLAHEFEDGMVAGAPRRPSYSERT